MQDQRTVYVVVCTKCDIQDKDREITPEMLQAFSSHHELPVYEVRVSVYASSECKYCGNTVVRYTCFLQRLFKVWTKLLNWKESYLKILFLSAKCSKHIVTVHAKIILFVYKCFSPNGLFNQSVFSYLIRETNNTSRHVVVPPRYQIVNFLHKTTETQVVDRTSCTCDLILIFKHD